MSQVRIEQENSEDGHFYKPVRKGLVKGSHLSRNLREREQRGCLSEERHTPEREHQECQHLWIRGPESDRGYGWCGK